MRSLAATIVLFLSTTSGATETIPNPSQVFGHQVGADHKLIAYPDVLDYLATVAAASDRVSIEDAGASTLGNPM